MWVQRAGCGCSRGVAWQARGVAFGWTWRLRCSIPCCLCCARHPCIHPCAQLQRHPFARSVHSNTADLPRQAPCDACMHACPSAPPTCCAATLASTALTAPSARPTRLPASSTCFSPIFTLADARSAPRRALSGAPSTLASSSFCSLRSAWAASWASWACSQVAGVSKITRWLYRNRLPCLFDSGVQPDSCAAPACASSQPCSCWIDLEACSCSGGHHFGLAYGMTI
jgi:hypothetical protein